MSKVYRVAAFEQVSGLGGPKDGSSADPKGVRACELMVTVEFNRISSVEAVSIGPVEGAIQPDE